MSCPTSRRASSRILARRSRSRSSTPPACSRGSKPTRQLTRTGRTARAAARRLGAAGSGLLPARRDQRDPARHGRARVGPAMSGDEQTLLEQTADAIFAKACTPERIDAAADSGLGSRAVAHRSRQAGLTTLSVDDGDLLDAAIVIRSAAAHSASSRSARRSSASWVAQRSASKTRQVRSRPAAATRRASPTVGWRPRSWSWTARSTSPLRSWSRRRTSPASPATRWPSASSDTSSTASVPGRARAAGRLVQDCAALRRCRARARPHRPVRQRARGVRSPHQPVPGSPATGRADGRGGRTDAGVRRRGGARLPDRRRERVSF